jgi:hypothetical protein
MPISGFVLVQPEQWLDVASRKFGDDLQGLIVCHFLRPKTVELEWTVEFEVPTHDKSVRPMRRGISGKLGLGRQVWCIAFRNSSLDPLCYQLQLF